MLRTITSIEEFKKHYFPISYEKEYEEKLFREGTPEEIGRYLGQKTIDKIMKCLRD